MNVLIIGGYGEFGGRLGELLIRDDHRVIIAGRRLEKAQQYCQQHGGEPLQLDINTDLDKIAALGVNVVVDAAGPFQSYGTDDNKYRVALTALNSGAHYLDLSDDGNFTKGIVALDVIAKEHNRFALSGASSTPALSGAAVSAMQSHFSTLNKIETSILPGSRAPQGYSVMQAILAQVGNPVKFWRNDEWVNCSGWSEPAIKSTDVGVTRKANLITAADVILFPAFFKANSVLFRAGLAVPVMHNSLQWLGSLRQRGWLPELTKFIKPLRWLANRITPFGNDHGGMLVEVTGERANTLVLSDDKNFKVDDGILNNNTSGLGNNHDLLRATWTLKAEPRHGPYVPTIAVRALLRNINSIAPGARACIDELPMEQFVDAMQDIKVTTEFDQEPFTYVFQSALGDEWNALPTALRETHKVVDQKTLTGTAKVSRGSSVLTKIVAWVFRFPAACESIPVQVTKTRIGNAEIWSRDFDGQIFRSTLSTINRPASANKLAMIQEQFGLLKFVLALPIIEGVMHMQVLSGSCLGVPIPSWLLPISNAREFTLNNRMHFSVELLGPLKTGLIVRYEGSLE